MPTGPVNPGYTAVHCGVMQPVGIRPHRVFFLEATDTAPGTLAQCGEVIMTAMASQITGVLIICLTVCSGIESKKTSKPALLTFMRGIHRWQVDSPHKGPLTRRMFPFDDVIMVSRGCARTRTGKYDSKIESFVVTCGGWLSTETVKQSLVCHHPGDGTQR